MKRICFVFVFIFLLSTLLCVDVNAAEEIGLPILTHEGSEVSYSKQIEFGDAEKNLQFYMMYSGRIDEAEVYDPSMTYTVSYSHGEAVSIAGTMSNLYNCHAFALNFKGSIPINSEAIWISDPDIYFTDGSLVEIQINEVEDGDIIAYYNETLEVSHTGVIIGSAIKTLDGLKIRSKDGCGLLLEHGPRGCEYYKSDVQIKFFRWNHLSNGVYNSYNDTKHYHGCQKCNFKFYSNHSIICTQTDSAFYHLKSCTICSYSVNESHNFNQVGTKYRCISCKFVSSFQPIIPNGRSATEILFICSYDESQSLMTYEEMLSYLISNRHYDLLVEFKNFYSSMNS